MDIRFVSIHCRDFITHKSTILFFFTIYSSSLDWYQNRLTLALAVMKCDYHQAAQKTQLNSRGKFVHNSIGTSTFYPFNIFPRQAFNSIAIEGYFQVIVTFLTTIELINLNWLLEIPTFCIHSYINLFRDENYSCISIFTKQYPGFLT